VGGDIPIDNKALLVTDFMNLKIKLAQSFRDDHISRIYMCVFIEMSTHIYIYMSICIYTVFLYKKEKRKTKAKTSAGSVGNGFGSSGPGRHTRKAHAQRESGNSDIK
jgi:hypothetical protein